MTEKEKLIEMVEKEPELLKIIQSKEHMAVLVEINKKPPKIEELITRVLYFMNNTGSKDTSIKNIDTEIFASDSNEVIVI